VQDITIFDQIGQYYGYNKKYLRYELEAANGQPVRVLISSDGGDVTEGVALGSMLEMYPGEVETLGIGLVASIATVPFLSAPVGKVKMTKNSWFMFHSPWGGAVGTASDMRSTADTLEKMNDMLAEFYVDNIKKRNKAGADTLMRVKEMMAAETWLTAQQAQDLGFIDEVISGGQYEDQINIIPMQNRLSQYRHTPAALINKTDNMSFFKSIKTMLGGEDTAPQASADAVDLTAARAALEAAGFTVAEAAADAATDAVDISVGDVTESMEYMAKELAELKAQLKNKVGAPSGGGEGSSKPAAGKPSAAQAKFISKLSPLVELLKQN
jgi:ATP-dependent protease ClpP protease subunit